jgi:hypothetical protein
MMMSILWHRVYRKKNERRRRRKLKNQYRKKGRTNTIDSFFSSLVCSNSQ